MPGTAVDQRGGQADEHVMEGRAIDRGAQTLVSNCYQPDTHCQKIQLRKYRKGERSVSANPQYSWKVA